MKPCRLKIITAIISPDEKTEDKAEIHFVSMNPFSLQTSVDNKNKKSNNDKKEKNLFSNNKNTDDIMIIKESFEKNRIKKQNKTKRYTINELFNSPSNNRSASDINHNYKTCIKKGIIISNKFHNTNKNAQKIKYISKNEKNKLISYSYKTNNNSKFNNNSKELFKAPEVPKFFDLNKTNQKIEQNISNVIEYNKKINDIIKIEPIEEQNRENIMKNNKNKIESLQQENNNLYIENQIEINHEDELKGEIIILKNQYDSLINILEQKEKKIKQYQDMIKNKYMNDKAKLSKNKKLLEFYNSLNDALEKNEILLVTPNIINGEKNFNIENENNLITLLLKGYLINLKILNIDDFINKIWNKEKPIQTLETISEEILLLINNATEGKSDIEMNKKIIMSYLFSFCCHYYYITKNDFKLIFEEKLRNLNNYNKNIYLNKLYRISENKLDDFMKLLKSLDINNSGIISFQNFESALKELNIIYSIPDENFENILQNKDTIDILQFLITIMKENKSDSNDKVNLYDLYYTNFIKLINDNYKSNIPLYKLILKQYLVDNKINSLNEFLQALLINNEIIINKGLNKYVDNQIFYKFLVGKNVIKENENYLFPVDEDNLIDIEALINDFDNPESDMMIIDDYEEKKKNAVNELINDFS